MGSKAWDEMLAGNPNSPSAGAFQYGQAIRGPRSTYETGEAYDQRYQGMNEARELQNMYFRNQQTQFNNQQNMLKSLSGGSSTQGGGNVGAPSTANRFEAGLSDAELRLKNLLDNPDSIQQTAAYKFRVGQGQEALQRSLGAKGLLNSGNRLMELTKYGQDMGSQEYDNQFGRIKDLVGGYSGSWIGDKNANTGIYNAQNQARANNQRNALGWASLAWDMNKPQTTGGGRSYGVNSGFDKALYTTDNGQTTWDNQAKRFGY